MKKTNYLNLIFILLFLGTSTVYGGTRGGLSKKPSSTKTVKFSKRVQVRTFNPFKKLKQSKQSKLPELPIKSILKKTSPSSVLLRPRNERGRRVRATASGEYDNSQIRPKAVYLKEEQQVLKKDSVVLLPAKSIPKKTSPSNKLEQNKWPVKQVSSVKEFERELALERIEREVAASPPREFLENFEREYGQGW